MQSLVQLVQSLFKVRSNFAQTRKHYRIVSTLALFGILVQWFHLHDGHALPAFSSASLRWLVIFSSTISLWQLSLTFYLNPPVCQWHHSQCTSSGTFEYLVMRLVDFPVLEPF